MKREDDFNGVTVDGFSSLSALFSLMAGSVPLFSDDGAGVLEGVALDLPRKLKVGRVRNGR